MQPLAVTVSIEPAVQERFDAERLHWARVAGTARLIMFHAVPSDLEERVRVDLVDVAGPPFPIGVAAVLPTGSGVAYAITSPELVQRRRQLQNLWWDDLGDRDRRPYRPHVTVLHGAEPATARAALGVLRRAFRRFQVRAEGFVLWRTGAEADEAWTELARIPFA